jgi:hypothetical protein
MTTPHDIDRLQRIRLVTSDYSGYQGLNTCLLGVFGVWLGMAPLTGEGPLTALFPFGVLLIAALFIAVQLYYRRRFGQVRPLRSTRRLVWALFVPIALVFAYMALMITTNILEVQGGWVFGVFIALALLTVWGSDLRHRWHYLVGAVLILAFTVLPLGPLFPSGTHPVEWEYPVMVPVVGGLVFIVNGLLDHRTLARSLRPVAEGGKARPRAHPSPAFWVRFTNRRSEWLSRTTSSGSTGSATSPPTTSTTRGSTCSWWRFSH